MNPRHTGATALGIAEDRLNLVLLAKQYSEVTSVALHGTKRRRHTNGIDVRDLSPFSDCSFDLVTAVGVFGYIKEGEQGFRSIARVLRSGGLFVLHLLPNELSNTETAPTVRFSRLSAADWFGYLPEGTHISLYLYGIKWVNRVLNEAGLEPRIVTCDEPDGLHRWWFARKRN